MVIHFPLEVILTLKTKDKRLHICVGHKSINSLKFIE